VCTRAHRVYANPGQPKLVIERTLRQAICLLELNLSVEEQNKQFLEEAMAYWALDSIDKLYYLPQHLDNTFLFQCELNKNSEGSAKIYKTHPLTRQPHFVAIRHDVPAEEIQQFLSSPEQWWRASEMVHEQIIQAMNLLGNLNNKSLGLLVCFRLKKDGDDVILPTLLSRDLKLRKLGRVPENWVAFVQDGQRFERLSSQSLATKRIIKRAMGQENIHSEKFRAIAATRLAVIGCGALGSYLVDLLAKGGIQDLFLADGDTLTPENLARHTLSGHYCGEGKARGMKDQIQASFPECKIQFWPGDIRHPLGKAHLLNWGASLVLSSTGELSAEMFISDLCRRHHLPCWFTRVEAKMAAGHLVYQPPDSQENFDFLSEEINGELFYKFRISPDGAPIDERELGCQTTFTPFSGVDSALFSALCARQVLEYAQTPLSALTAYRWIPGAATLEKVYG